MWQRFTERARRAIFYAQEQSQRLGNNFVSTEHLLLGLLRESDTVASRTLERLGVEVENLKTEVENLCVQQGERAGSKMTLTPRAKMVIDLAYEEARALNNNYIGTEHLLLGLIREPGGVASTTLAAQGVTAEAARQHIVAMQSEENGDAPGRSSTPAFAASSPSTKPGVSKWQRLSPRARRAVYFSQEEAQEHGEGYVSTEHLLMGLLRDKDCGAFQIIEGLSLNASVILSDLKRHLPDKEPRVSQDITLTPRAKRAVDLASDEAQNLGADLIGTEHLLLGLIHENEGLGARVLGNYTDLEKARRQVVAYHAAKHLGSEKKPVEEEEDLWHEYSESGKSAILKAHQEKDKYSQDRVSAEHLLLAIMEQPDTPAAQVLNQLGITPESIRSALEAIWQPPESSNQ